MCLLLPYINHKSVITNSAKVCFLYTKSYAIIILFVCSEILKTAKVEDKNV